MKCPHYTKGKCTNKGLINVGKLIGSVKTEKKKKASIRNGKLGGRPKGSKNKFKSVTFICDDCGAQIKEKVPVDVEINCNLTICEDCQNK